MTRTLQGRYKDVTKTLKTLQGHYKDVTQTLQGPYCQILNKYDQMFTKSHLLKIKRSNAKNYTGLG